MSAPAGSQSSLAVGLNLVYLVPGETGGMEVYARELIRAMREFPGAPRLTAFVSREGAEAKLDWLDGLPVVNVGVQARRRTEWVRGEQQLLPRLARKAGVDVLHSLASTAPLYGRFRRVTTVHDLIYLVHPEAHFGVLALGMRVVVGQAARRSHRLIAVSKSTATDIEERLRINRERIDVVPNGVLPPPPAPDAQAIEEVRRRHGLDGRQVVLAASAKRPHKNLLRLLEAVALLDDRPVLVLPGYPTEHEQELRERATALGLDADTRFLGWLGDEGMEALYAVADAFVMPSLYEGFGLPVLEAMIRGVPVACSDRSSLPEVAGDAALLFDPEHVGQIADALRTLLQDGPVAGRLREAGKRRASEFSWQRTARQTVESYQRAVGALGYDPSGEDPGIDATLRRELG
jgi:glycosyltransferase involved in cell wall biosynthesis